MDLWRFFIASLRKAAPSALLQTIDLPREMDISIGMSRCPLQDPLRFRARFLALQVAEAIVDGFGVLRLDIVKIFVEELERGRYLIAPYLEQDALLFEHIYSSLRFLLQSEQARQLLNKFSPPLCHRGADRLVRDTLWPRAIKKITSSDVMKAVLASLLTWLRQTTGSCFATAPAILIQQRQPLLLLQDLFDLVTFGSLKRIVVGREYLVPLCPSMELADLLRSIGSINPEDLILAPGLRAAFAVSGSKMPLDIGGARTPKELIEQTIMKDLGLDEKAIEEEEGLKKLEMTALLAKQSAIYYQKPSPRAVKLAKWKEKTAAAFTAYQALGDCALLRAWESTVASFSDVKVDIGRWNLYVSLGMHPDHPGGIGAFLYDRVNVRLQNLNDRIQSLQSEYDQTLLLAQNAKRQQLEREYTSAMYRANALVEHSKQLSKDSETLSKLFSIMIQGYDRLIPESFQEIFDPSLATDLSDMIDDSAAGFRLVYKHGRTDSSQWTLIRTSDEFISSIREFFSYAEREIGLEFASHREWIEELSTELIQFIQTGDFLAAALERVQKNPSMQGSSAKPWEYISGGTMPALVMTYFNRSEPFTSIERNVQNEEDLLSFLVECSKTVEPMLMHSPTHAFIYHPNFLPKNIPEALSAMKTFWSKIEIKQEEFLADLFATRLAQQEQALFLHSWRQQHFGGSLQKFRIALLQALPKTRKDPESLVDSFLYESFPLIDPKKAMSLGTKLVGHCDSFFKDSLFYTPTSFRERVKAAALSNSSSPLFSEDLDELIALALRAEGLAAPRPILFADTNWSAGYFGLAYSPLGSLNLWRFQRTGMTGVPMRQWFDLQRDGKWIALTHPEEYRA